MCKKEEFPIPDELKPYYKDEPGAKIFGVDAANVEHDEKGKEKVEDHIGGDEQTRSEVSEEGNVQFLAPNATSRPVPKSPSIYSLSSSALSPSTSLYSISSLKRSPSLCFDLSRFGEKDLDSIFSSIIPEEILQNVWEENHKVARYESGLFLHSTHPPALPHNTTEKGSSLIANT